MTPRGKNNYSRIQRAVHAVEAAIVLTEQSPHANRACCLANLKGLRVILAKIRDDADPEETKRVRVEQCEKCGSVRSIP